MRYFLYSALLICLALFQGCSSQGSFGHQHTHYLLEGIGSAPTTSYKRLAEWRLDPRAHIAVIDLDKQAREKYPRAAGIYGLALKEAFSKYFFHADFVEAGPVDALADGYDYAVVAKFIDMQDQLNSTGELLEGTKLHDGRQIGSDRVAMQMYLFDARSGALIDRVDFESRAALFSRTQRLPTDLIPGSVDTVVAALSGSP